MTKESLKLKVLNLKILSVDTSATAASVALSEEGKLIGETFINTSLTHSQTLIPMVEQLFEQYKNGNIRY